MNKYQEALDKILELDIGISDVVTYQGELKPKVKSFESVDVYDELETLQELIDLHNKFLKLEEIEKICGYGIIKKSLMV